MIKQLMFVSVVSEEETLLTAGDGQITGINEDDNVFIVTGEDGTIFINKANLVVWGIKR